MARPKYSNVEGEGEEDDYGYFSTRNVLLGFAVAALFVTTILMGMTYENARDAKSAINDDVWQNSQFRNQLVEEIGENFAPFAPLVPLGPTDMVDMGTGDTHLHLEIQAAAGKRYIDSYTKSLTYGDGFNVIFKGGNTDSGFKQYSQFMNRALNSTQFVAFTHGSMEAFHLFIKSIQKLRGTNVVYVSANHAPYFGEYKNFVTFGNTLNHISAGGVVNVQPESANAGAIWIEPDNVAAWKASTGLQLDIEIINAPNNPDGYVPTGFRHGARYNFLDLVYDEYSFTGSFTSVINNLIPQATAWTSSASKSAGFPGIRYGWIVYNTINQMAFDTMWSVLYEAVFPSPLSAQMFNNWAADQVNNNMWFYKAMRARMLARNAEIRRYIKPGSILMDPALSTGSFSYMYVNIPTSVFNALYVTVSGGSGYGDAAGNNHCRLTLMVPEYAWRVAMQRLADAHLQYPSYFM